MKTVENINKQLPFTVPAGYFDNLPARIVERCSEQSVEETKRRSLWEAIRPQLALAAGFALLVGLGSLALKFASGSSSNEVALTSYFSTFDIEVYEVEQQRLSAEGSNDEAIVEYLLGDSNAGYLILL